jgi:hypothetical protein
LRQRNRKRLREKPSKAKAKEMLRSEKNRRLQKLPKYTFHERDSQAKHCFESLCWTSRKFSGKNFFKRRMTFGEIIPEEKYYKSLPFNEWGIAKALRLKLPSKSKSRTCNKDLAVLNLCQIWYDSLREGTFPKLRPRLKFLYISLLEPTTWLVDSEEEWAWRPQTVSNEKDLGDYRYVSVSLRRYYATISKLKLKYSFRKDSRLTTYAVRTSDPLSPSRR